MFSFGDRLEGIGWRLEYKRANVISDNRIEGSLILATNKRRSQMRTRFAFCYVAYHPMSDRHFPDADALPGAIRIVVF